MKKFLPSLFMMLFSIASYSQSKSDEVESVLPTLGVELERTVALAIINDVKYVDVVVEIKAYDSSDFWSGVKITVKDAVSGKKIYKKRLEKSYLYGYSDGSIQIGKGNVLIQMILFKHQEYDVWLMTFREKGLY